MTDPSMRAPVRGYSEAMMMANTGLESVPDLPRPGCQEQRSPPARRRSHVRTIRQDTCDDRRDLERQVVERYRAQILLGCGAESRQKLHQVDANEVLRRD